MADLERSRMIELLGRLGAQDDAVVVRAARELDRMLSQSGSSWETLLRPRNRAARPRRSMSTSQSRRTKRPRTTALREEGVVGAADLIEAGRLIDRLLARADLSATTREDLTEMKRAIAEHRFDAMDHRYVGALARRLGA